MAPPLIPQCSLPFTVDALIDHIDKQLAPVRTFTETDTFATMQRYSGARALVDLLRSLQAERDERTAELMK